MPGHDTTIRVHRHTHDALREAAPGNLTMDARIQRIMATAQHNPDSLVQENHALRARLDDALRELRRTKDHTLRETAKWRGRYNLANGERQYLRELLRLAKDNLRSEDGDHPREHEPDYQAFHARLREAVLESPDRHRMDKLPPHHCTECRVPFDDDERSAEASLGTTLCRMCRGILVAELTRRAEQDLESEAAGAVPQ